MQKFELPPEKEVSLESVQKFEECARLLKEQIEALKIDASVLDKQLENLITLSTLRSNLKSSNYDENVSLDEIIRRNEELHGLKDRILKAIRSISES